jgi:mRNA-degrading endonuclease toxin of MazEF toxin-antitoxin module
MTYKHGHVVSIPDPHERRPSRPVVIISDSDSPDHGELYTTVALTGSKHYGQNRYAVTVERDEPATGELLKRSYVEPWVTQQVHHDDIRDVHARFGDDTMKRIAKAFATMVLRG